MKVPVTVLVGAGFLAWGVVARGAPPADRPNIIIIYTDDQGYADLGCQGVVEDIRTPHLDRMARSGVRCTAGYVTAPQCSPSRTGLLTGRYQQRFAAEDNDNNVLNRQAAMPPGVVMLPERLRAAGYRTCAVGKWDMGVPSARGLTDYFLGNMSRYLANFTLEGASLPAEDGRITVPGFRVDIQTRAACEFLGRDHKSPFFLYLAYFAPHTPLEAPPEYLKRFPGTMAERRRLGLALMAAVDDGVGRVLDLLEQRGWTEKTLVFFASDNGAPLRLTKPDEPIPHRSKADGGWDGSLNDPWVGQKGMLSEGGIRVPFLVRYPGVLPRGGVYARPVSTLDISATALAAAGLTPAPGQDGVNLLPYLKGDQAGDPHAHLFWRFWRQAAVRAGDWKYLTLSGGREFLFDLGGDPHERRNRIAEEPAVAAALRRRLEEWAGGLQPAGLSREKMSAEEIRWYDHHLGGAR
jgi:arylsulfatase A-like enzyme